MEFPYKYFFQEYYISANIHEIWIFDKKTGIIYAKEIILPLLQDQATTFDNQKQKYA